MLTTQIIDRAFDSITQNFGTALRISLVPFFCGVALFLAVNHQLVLRVLEGETVLLNDGSQIFKIFLSILPLVFAFFYSAVRWHRFSLEVDDVCKAPFVRSLLYGLAMIAISVVILLMMLIPVMILSLAGIVQGRISITNGSYLESIARGPEHVIINVIATLGFAYLFLRWSPTLVRIAIRRPASASSLPTSTFKNELLVMALIYTVATFLWSLLSFAGLPFLMMMMINVVFMWFAYMMSISILTEVYRVTEPELQAT